MIWMIWNALPLNRLWKMFQIAQIEALLTSLPMMMMIQDPRSMIWDPRFVIQDSRSKIQDPRFEIQDLRSKIWDPRSEIQDSRSKIQDPRFKIQDLRSKIEIQDSRSKIQDPWHYTYSQALKALAENDVDEQFKATQLNGDQNCAISDISCNNGIARWTECSCQHWQAWSLAIILFGCMEWATCKMGNLDFDKIGKLEKGQLNHYWQAWLRFEAMGWATSNIVGKLDSKLLLLPIIGSPHFHLDSLRARNILSIASSTQMFTQTSKSQVQRKCLHKHPNI